MSKKDNVIAAEGEVIENLPGLDFSVRLESGHEVRARLSGKMAKNRITVMPGDLVTVEMSPYDLTKGRITYRHKKESEFSKKAA